MDASKLDLDVDCPEKVAPVPRSAADKFQGDALELNACWQDKSAGKP